MRSYSLVHVHSLSLPPLSVRQARTVSPHKGATEQPAREQTSRHRAQTQGESTEPIADPPRAPVAPFYAFVTFHSVTLQVSE